MSKSLFKEAIAEAKAVREAAITNAKKALEESLTPHLKSMLAAKLQEMEDNDEELLEAEELEEAADSGFKKVNVKKTAVKEAEEDEDAEDVEPEEAPEGEDIEDAEEMDMEPEEAPEGEETPAEEDIEVGELSVEEFKEIVRDIIAQEIGGEPSDELGADMDAGDIEGMGDEPEDIDMEGEPGMEMEPEMEPDEEEIDLDEILRELGGSKKEDAYKAKYEASQRELNEAVRTIRTLRQNLQEVNLLNSKLLYTTKLFKANNLSESQKVNIITAFDKAETVKEAKLVYESVSRSFASKPKKSTAVIKEHRGTASRAAGVNPKSNVLLEPSETVLRMQKLAGIIK